MAEEGLAISKCPISEKLNSRAESPACSAVCVYLSPSEMGAMSSFRPQKSVCGTPSGNILTADACALFGNIGRFASEHLFDYRSAAVMLFDRNKRLHVCGSGQVPGHPLPA